MSPPELSGDAKNHFYLAPGPLLPALGGNFAKQIRVLDLDQARLVSPSVFVPLHHGGRPYFPSTSLHVVIRTMAIALEPWHQVLGLPGYLRSQSMTACFE